MKQWALGLILLSAIFLALFQESEYGGPGQGELVIYNWPDYTPPALLMDFEEETGIETILKTYETNETVLAALAADDHDVVILSHTMVSKAIGLDLLEPVAPNAMPNFANVDPRWRDPEFDSGRGFTVPYAWGTLSYVVNTSVVAIDSLAVLFNPPSTIRGRVAILDDRDAVIDAALRFLRLPWCSAGNSQLKTLAAILRRQRPWVAIYDSRQVGERLVSGELYAGQVWNGQALRARLAKSSLKYIYPKEGVRGWMDNLAVPKGAKNLENAKRFMNWFMNPEKAAMVSNFVRFHNGILGSETHMDPVLAGAPEIVPPKNAPVPEFLEPCGDDIERRYGELWTGLSG